MKQPHEIEGLNKERLRASMRGSNGVQGSSKTTTSRVINLNITSSHKLKQHLSSKHQTLKVEHRINSRILATKNNIKDSQQSDHKPRGSNISRVNNKANNPTSKTGFV